MNPSPVTSLTAESYLRAAEAGCTHGLIVPCEPCLLAAIRAHAEAEVARAVEAEREACAKVVEASAEYYGPDIFPGYQGEEGRRAKWMLAMLTGLASDIRARSATEPPATERPAKGARCGEPINVYDHPCDNPLPCPAHPEVAGKPEATPCVCGAVGLPPHLMGAATADGVQHRSDGPCYRVTADPAGFGAIAYVGPTTPEGKALLTREELRESLEQSAAAAKAKGVRPGGSFDPTPEGE